MSTSLGSVWICELRYIHKKGLNKRHSMDIDFIQTFDGVNTENNRDIKGK